MGPSRPQDTPYDKTVWTRWQACKIDPSKSASINLTANHILKNATIYNKVSDATGVPFFLIGAIHFREASLSFKGHLYNGDPLDARTVQFPPGRPIDHEPPFTWPESAIDAIKYKGLDLVKDWDLVRALIHGEAYNGMSYRNKGLPSPYVWSGTDQYKCGLFVKDHVFDRTQMDDRFGLAAIFMALRASGVDLNEHPITF